MSSGSRAWNMARSVRLGQRKSPFSLSSINMSSSLQQVQDRGTRWADKNEDMFNGKDGCWIHRKNPWKVKQQRYSKHISNLVKKSKQSEAVQVLEQMKRAKVRPDAVVYNMIISGYVRERDANMAFKTFNQMKKRGLTPTDHTYSSMFAVCGAVGHSAAPILDKVQTEMERRGVVPNNIATNSLISALAQCGRHHDAIEVYLNMTNRQMDPDLCTFGALLLAIGKDKTRGMEAAQRVWSELRASGLVIDLHCFNMLLQVLRDAGLEGVVDMQSGLRNVYGQPLRRVVPQVDVSEMPQVDTMERKGIPQVAEWREDQGGSRKELSREDKGDWIRETSLPNNTLYVKGALEFPLSRDHSIVLNVGSFGLEFSPHVRWLEKRSIENLFAVLKQNHLKPDIHTFHLLLHLTLDPAHLLVTMKERKIVPDSKFMTAAITQQVRQLRNLHGAKVLFEYSKNIGLELGQVGYQAMASSCREQRDGMNLLMKMKADGVMPNEHVMGTLIGLAVQNHSYEYLTSLIRTMMHLDFTPNSTILQILDTVASFKVKSPRQQRRLNGFKGFYAIWKRKVYSSKLKRKSVDPQTIQIDQTLLQT